MACLRNVSRRMFVASLPHAQACTESDCLCDSVSMIVRELDPVSGEHGTRVFDKDICASLHLAPGQEQEVPDCVLEVRAIKKAMNRGQLRVVK